MSADLEGSLAGGLQPFRSMGPGQAEDTDAGAEALFRMGPATQDDFDQGLGIGSVGGGIATDAIRGPIRITAV